MTVRIAINGMGRIGRCIARAKVEYGYDDIELVAVNASFSTSDLIHFMKYDSVHGTFPFVAQAAPGSLVIGNQNVKHISEYDPSKLPWKELGVDVVMECTGKFKSLETAGKHIESGAKKVIISAPGSDDVPTWVLGVNDSVLSSRDSIVSIGSCTTNCLAPVAKLLHDHIGIEAGFMTTVHAYTNDQNLVDSRHSDLRRARAAALSMIPTSTGAAKAIGKVLPELEGRLDGVAVRVPTPNVSFVDLTFTASRDTSKDEINQIMAEAANGTMAGILRYNDEPLVSIDFTHDPHSSVFDATGTKVVNKRLCRVAAWYDNEWGFSVRMLDIARKLAS